MKIKVGEWQAMSMCERPTATDFSIRKAKSHRLLVGTEKRSS